MQKKIFLVFISLILIGVLTTGLLTLSLLKVNHEKNVKDKLVTNARLVQEFIDNENIEKKQLQRTIKLYSREINARITIIDSEGKVIVDSEEKRKEILYIDNKPEIKQAFQGKIGTDKRYDKNIDMEMYHVAMPLDKIKDRFYVITFSVKLGNISETNNLLFKNIIISICAGLLVALLLALRYVRSITDPIKELTNATKNIARGNYGEKVYFKTDDELGILADNFNIMSQELQKNINEIQDRNTKTKAILTSVINGIIALDNDKRIIFINPVAERLFGFNEKEIKGKYILEVVRNNVLDEQIQSLLEENVSSKREIEIFEPQNRILNIYTNPIRLSDDPTRKIGVLIIIQDVTEIRKLERVRKDFVANVSHELKTPLTSIKGFVETLKNGAVNNSKIRDKFIDIIDIEVGRLTSLIEDLLVLSDIENKSTMVNKTEINVNKSINEVIQILSEIAKRKNIEIINKVNNNLPNLYGNITWFKQMLINLIDNAIKYTPEDGEVTIVAYYLSDNIVFKIIDTGIGIEKTHLDRLFERFYRVDKARSRRVGGTGLGLAIVKHIVIAFNGKIDVKSEINKGTEFKVSIPTKNKKV